MSWNPQFQPLVPAPKLAGEYAAVLDNLLRVKPFEFVTHPCFSKSGIAKHLFREEFDRVNVELAWHKIYAGFNNSNFKIDKSLLFKGAEEQTAFLQLNYARYSINRLQVRAKSRRLSIAEQKQLVHWDRVAKKLKDVIACANLGLCMAFVHRRYKHQNLIPVNDLVAYANMALLRAIDKFNVSFGFKFSTYASRAIITEIKRNLGKEGKRKAHEVCSFEESEATSEQSSYDNREERDAALILQELQEILSTNRANLNNVEAEVIRKRFKGLTLHDTGMAVGEIMRENGECRPVSKERARQVQREAIGKLRVAMNVPA